VTGGNQREQILGRERENEIKLRSKPIDIEQTSKRDIWTTTSHTEVQTTSKNKHPPDIQPPFLQKRSNPNLHPTSIAFDLPPDLCTGHPPPIDDLPTSSGD